MKASLALAIFLAFACVSMTPDVSDAARLGGGRSFGSQPAMRQSAPAPVQRPQTMQQRQMQQNAPQQRSGFLGGMGGILGGVLAGTLIGSLLSGGGFSGGGFMDIILLAVIAFIAYKIFSRRRAPAPAAATAAPGGMAAPQAPYQPMAREDMQQPAANDAWGGLRSQPIASAEAVNGPTLPAGFDAEEFLRGAKMAYTRLQKAWDSRDLNDIAQFVGIETSGASAYLAKLISLKLVSRTSPLGSSDKERNNIYLINDSFFMFYYRFISPMKSFINADNPFPAMEKIRNGLSRYMGLVWEQICIDWMHSWNAMQNSPFIYDEVGRWWGGSARTRKQVEIDVLAWNRESAIIGECKWWNDKVDTSVYSDALKKADEIRRDDKYIYLFSKSGFTDDLAVMAAGSSKLRLVSLSDILA